MSTQRAIADTPNFMFEPAAETMPRSELKALQLSRLKTTLERAYDKVPHYKKKFDAAGVKPADLKSLADLARFPFTVKTDLRDNYPFGMFAVPRDQLLRLHASSGTTGKPTVVGYTKGDLDLWADLMARSLAASARQARRHRAQRLWLRPVHRRARRALRRRAARLHRGADVRRRHRAAGHADAGLRRHVLCATPSYALNIAEVARRHGRRHPQTAAAHRLLRRRAVDRRHAPRHRGAARHQGGRHLRPVGNHRPGRRLRVPRVQTGLHGWEDHFLFEIVDPDTLQPLPMGEAGELVITTLTKEALPMIRYRTRDITRLSDEPCACGRSHVRIMRVTGRNDDMLIIRGVNVYPSQIEAVLVGFPGHRAALPDRADARGRARRDDGRGRARARLRTATAARKAEEVTHHIKSLIGVTCNVVPQGARRGAALAGQGRAGEGPAQQDELTARRVARRREPAFSAGPG